MTDEQTDRHSDSKGSASLCCTAQNLRSILAWPGRSDGSIRLPFKRTSSTHDYLRVLHVGMHHEASDAQISEPLRAGRNTITIHSVHQDQTQLHNASASLSLMWSNSSGVLWYVCSTSSLIVFGQKCTRSVEFGPGCTIPPFPAYKTKQPCAKVV